ncbi:cold-shock protein [Propioniciclava flava]|uniref:Cold-shock protein n=1 Tax=Propioniciclava flava TaxID=2072026 RepID=A0A4Q2ELP3_9ACTN|nr:cold shock domain-containing protein [Propioniciclava flava]RXW32975.1 cold-shock protein [Propioniciclava flava]
MPSGRVRFFDADKGFGFIAKDDGGDEVYVHSSALPENVATLKKGQRVEFGLIEGRRGEQAISLRLLEAPVSLSKATRKSPEQMAVIVEDLIKMLDALGGSYRRHRHPDAKQASNTAHVLRAVADELEL